MRSVGLPIGCAGRQLDGVAVGGTLTESVVNSGSDPLCPLQLIRIEPELAIVLPIQKERHAKMQTRPYQRLSPKQVCAVCTSAAGEP
ncbi:hypothetical protein [Amycolatopsis speibonae]|uniref:Uncharacterized protein n=1 Tax=Amycolatopsis speibonae TaxID=1450224 RepID=A0ABV7PE48_9PSEU